jgi:ubiquinone/menaquinone biosynthesis C-methylase UbiE
VPADQTLEQDVAAHYGRDDLFSALAAALVAAGNDMAALTPADLAPVDEFHIGGRPATVHLADRLGFAPGAHLLDIGCGIGGASRYFAAERGCHVTGIDLTEAYCEAARRLAASTGLAGRTAYRQASALDLPFDDGAFDGAYMLHVGMNIADKPRLFREVRRVLRPGACFGIYDVLQGAGGAPYFPVPWATGPATSFLVTADGLQALLRDAGFEIVAVEDRSDFARAFMQAARQRGAAGGPSPLGLHLLMGADAPMKIANLTRSLEEGCIAPTEAVARAV